MSFPGFRGLTKKSKKGKAEALRKVTIVGSLQDVDLPPANDELKKSLLSIRHTNAPNRRLDKVLSVYSQSETALNRITLHRSASDEIHTLSQKTPTEPLARHCSERPSKKEYEPESKPGLFATNSNVSASSYSSSLPSPPLSLDIPKMGPVFGIEEFLRDTRPDINDLADLSTSASSSPPEIWESRFQSCSSASSHSSLRSDALLQNSSSETNAGESSSSLSSADSKKIDNSRVNSPSPVEAESVTISPNVARKQKQYLKQKPLPPVPSTLNISKAQRNQKPAVHIAELTSKYSSSRSTSPVDRLIKSKAADKTLSEAASDLERELDMLVLNAHNDAPSPGPPPRKPGHTVPQLNLTSNADKKASSKSKQGSTKSQQHSNHPPSKQQQTYKAFPPPKKTTSVNSPTVQSNHYKSKSADAVPAKEINKQCSQSSPSGKFVTRKLRSTVHLPTLRRPKISAPILPKQEENKADETSKSPVVSLREEQVALARSTDRYIDAEIAKALSVDQDGNEDENDGDDDTHSANRHSEEGDWSTIYPLKAVKKLGIPLMSSSHIPRLSCSESEKALRQQLPKLETDSSIAAIHRQVVALSKATDKKYPETPDDFEQLRSFILDSSPMQSRKASVVDNPKSDDEKVFIRFDRAESVSEGASPHTQEVPLIMAPPAVSAATERPRVQSTLYELDEYGSTPQPSPRSIDDNISLPMPHVMPDEVILTLMMSVNNLDELFNSAQVNRQFYGVFKKNELSLIKNALYNMNPPAWELREMSPPWSEDPSGMKDPDAPVPQYTPSSYLRHYARDVFALARLKTLIFARCGSFLRPETIRGLTGEDDVRASEIDEAFWRIWTFCRIFGCGKNREGDINGQIDWLNAGVLAKKNKAGATVISAEPLFGVNNVLFDPPAGFGLGNADGLSCHQLYDMTEIWNCLGTLVQVFHHECKEARVAGVFDGLDIEVGDITKEEPMLEEWTHYLLTLGPSALIGLSSVFPTSSIKQQFAKAKQMGVTKWEAPEDGGSRSAFLREAISRTYERRVAEQSRASSPAVNSEEPVNSSPLQSQSNSNNSGDIYTPDHSLGSAISEEPCGHAVPPYSPDNNDNPPRYSSTFLDPVDKAIHKIVHDLGFSEHDAKWALKITDTGDMIDTNAAIQLLLRERQKRSRTLRFRSSSENRNDCLVDTTRHRGTVAWQWA